mmetsp:Transcript_94276/g.270344  ORF Transcript_94276/g.270344 Transcript_94276/m.270344 type:complete len:288 (+) Transcript_94276:575-1438(+)
MPIVLEAGRSCCCCCCCCWANCAATSMLCVCSECPSKRGSFKTPVSETWCGTSKVGSGFVVGVADPSMHFRLGVRGARGGKLDESEREVLTPAADPVRACFGVGRATAKSASMPCKLAVSKSASFAAPEVPRECCSTGKLALKTSGAFPAAEDDPLLEHLDAGDTSGSEPMLPNRFHDGDTSGIAALPCKLAVLRRGALPVADAFRDCRGVGEATKSPCCKPKVPNRGAFVAPEDDASFECFGVGVATKRSSMSCKLNVRAKESFPAGLDEQRIVFGDTLPTLFGEK